MTQIEQIKAEIERRIEQFKEERSKVHPTTPKSVDRLSLGARIAALEETLVFIQSLPAEQPSEELEYLATSLEETIGTSPQSRETIISYLQQAAQWQKEQMMKSAIDALVDEDTENVDKKTLLLIGEQRNALNTRLSNYEYGETVKLVIIKEDE